MLISTTESTKPCLWEYLAEGKLHIIVRAINNTNVMRLLKLDTCSTHDYASTGEQDFAFIQHAMMQWFTDSEVIVPGVVQLTQDFVDIVTDRIRPLRPPGRVKQSHMLELSTLAQLEHNYGIVYRPIHLARELTTSVHTLAQQHSGNHHSLSFDIKVKCGFKSRSPFVSMESHIKHRHSKFHMMQLHKLSKKYLKQHLKDSSSSSSSNASPLSSLSSQVDGHINNSSVGTEPPWGTFHSISKYDPCDLCSSSIPRVTNALMALIANPQNNLKVCIDGVHVYGWDKSTTTTAQDLAGICHDFLIRSDNGCINSTESCTISSTGAANGRDSSLLTVVQLMAAILSSGRTLLRLQEMQMLDLIDSEGAEAVFSRLESLAGSRDAAVAMLFAYFTAPVDSGFKAVCSYIVQRHYDSSSSNNEYSYFTCDHVSSGVPSVIKLLLDYRVDEYTSLADKATRLNAAMGLAGALSMEECLLLLKLWMMALVGKDASVIVAVEEMTGYYDHECPADEELKLASMEPFVVLRHQTTDSAGIVRVHTDCCTNAPRYFAYNLTLIDIGLKSIDKVWTKSAEESEISRVCEEAEKYLFPK